MNLAPEDMVTCDVSNMACSGGLLSQTMEYLSNEGVVTAECKPYASGAGQGGFCHHSCSDWTVPYTKYRCVKNSMVNPTTADEI